MNGLYYCPLAAEDALPAHTAGSCGVTLRRGALGQQGARTGQSCSPLLGFSSAEVKCYDCRCGFVLRLQSQ